MSEEMKKVMQKWSADAQVTEQVEDKTGGTPEPQFDTIRAEILHIIRETPGITGVHVRDIIRKRHHTQTDSSISSQISILFREFYVRREKAVFKGKRHTFAYFSIPPEESTRLRAAERKRMKAMKARMEKARQAKAEKAKAAHIPQEQIDLPFNEPVVAPGGPFVIAPTLAPTLNTVLPLNLTGYSAVDILNAINFMQAKALYSELKGAFGG
jgi:hypothetical protein